ncbi:hypothetical protein Lepto7375DRAFT_7756 [Leptolyngbya sp. PCC 7375]|nr:hypothetical protein Lepto7375DRAFT_7756 [Leptolyngbya sp. PCC 7375]
MVSTPTVSLDSTQDLKRIAIALEAWMAMQQRGPEMEYPVSQLSTFDWEAIGGQIVEADDQGATLVNWMMHNWRRSTVGKDFIFERPVNQSCRAILAVFSTAITSCAQSTID